jgi:antibiotic biosynthesis monooxygenase (ABM) superfamily enzyme
MQHSSASATRSQATAARWRVFVLNWLGVYPLVTALFALFGPHLQTLPLGLRTAIVSLVLVGFMTFVWLPLLAHLTRRFVHRP